MQGCRDASVLGLDSVSQALFMRQMHARKGLGKGLWDTYHG